jgi:PTS system nitrogen regulatory IIA component
MSDHEILTIKEVAEYLRVSERTVYDWAQKGEIPCGKLGTNWRFKRSEIERWADEKLQARPKPIVPKVIRVEDVLTPERVIFIHRARKNVALETLIDILALSPQIRDRDELAVDVCSEDIRDYQSLDGTCVRIICMIAAQKDQHMPYIRTLSAISWKLKEAGLRQKILSARDTDTIYRLMTEPR